MCAAMIIESYAVTAHALIRMTPAGSQCGGMGIHTGGPPSNFIACKMVLSSTFHGFR